MKPALNANDELTKGIQKGNEKDFHFLFTKYYQILYRQAQKLTGRDADSKDIALESFVHLWLIRENFATAANMTNYLFKVTRNLSFKCLEQQKRERSAMKEISYLNLISSIETKESEETNSQKLKAIYLAIEHLPDASRKVFLLKVLKNLKTSEIAELLKISVNTVKTHKTRAISALKNELAGKLRFL